MGSNNASAERTRGGVKQILGVLVGALLVAAACGGGSSALSKEEFLKQGNAICNKENDAINEAQKKAFPDENVQPDPAVFGKFFRDTIAPHVKAEIDGVEALKPPKDLQSAVDSLVNHAHAALAKLQEQADKDPAVLLSGSDDPFVDVNKEAINIGLTVCGSG